MLVYTKSITEHRVLASTQRGVTNPQEKGSATAIGEMLDKCARVVLPPEFIRGDSETVVYASLMETYCANNTKYRGFMKQALYEAPRKRRDEIEIYQSELGSWSLPPPLRQSRNMIYDFTGLGGKVRAIMDQNPQMNGAERSELAYHTMRLAFEHLMSRVIMALQSDKELLADPPQSLVLSGGVASNTFLRKVAASMLKARGFGDMSVKTPSPYLCTDNAAMIAWAGQEMYKAGWTTDNRFLPQGEWPIEEIIAGVDCWVRNDNATSPKPTEDAKAPPHDERQPPEEEQPHEPPSSPRPTPSPDSANEAEPLGQTRNPRTGALGEPRNPLASSASRKSHDARDERVPRRAKEIQRVRLLPPAYKRTPAPEGSLRTGLNTLKRWIGL
ncbi:hypothetical protein Daus18300_008867 [Diaporthe australafricana]|uniref:Gcp-like domain-containing protein n=1 Tax=Diaporthe australafricana TaxID=127596 RepID=A0ABR3WH85_9PEZI